MERASPPPFRAARRRWLAGAGGLALAAALGGCQPPLPPLRIGSLVFPGYELLFLAREAGWLDPAQVRLIELRSNTDTLRALASGQLEGAQLTLDEVLLGRARGIRLRIVHVLDISDGADAVIARPGLRQPGQLRGRRIGVEDSAGGVILLDALLKAQRLRVEDVVKVPMTLDRSVEMLTSGAVDAVVTAEPWASRLEAQGAVRVFDSRAIPGRIVDVLALRAEVLAARAPAVQHLVDAHTRAWWLWGREPAPDQLPARLMAPRLQVPAAQVPALFRGLRLPARDEVRAMLAPDGQISRTAGELLALMAERGMPTSPWQWDDTVDARFVSAPWGPPA
ncbi:putative aliphatic sulfonates-binding protein [Tepidimonas sediminis]|uniref:Putative aliphatic sulfonates-binding protein n=1 Tax=Tepidimonas sediminis TaxID=2588941 RepID=A0A554WIY9_9BURK|nr:ABC transporter substrate-binding protein [Tepidimonas sediminis]TSE23541.1 putative aliphatic sulfonates-binding protein [Tepidimonas sediminis]